MQREIDKALRQQQNIFDHVPVDFGSLETVDVVPTNVLELRGKCVAHFAELLVGDYRGQNHDAIRVEF